MSFFQKIKTGAAKAADKAQRTVETTKLSAQIAKKRKELKDNYTEIGAIVYKAYQTGDLSLAEPDIARLAQANAAIEEVIASLHEKIRELNDEHLCVCGQTVQANAAYCFACGRKLEVEEPAEDIEEEEAPEIGEAELEPWAEAQQEERPDDETPVYQGIAEIRCKMCGEYIRPDDRACTHCGAVQGTQGDTMR